MIGLALLISLLCVLALGCEKPPIADGGEEVPAITLSAEDKQLIELFGEDLHKIPEEQFSATVSAFSTANNGQVYRLIGAYSQKDGTAYLGDGDTAIELSNLTVTLAEGERYAVVGIVSAEQHDGHTHIKFDAVTVESYIAE